MLYELYILLFGISIAYAKDLFLEEKSTFMYNHSSFTSYFNDSHFL